MTERIIAVIIAVIIVLVSALSFAQQGKVASIKKGQSAPFAGLLYDYKADAVMSAKRETSEARHKIDKKYALDLQAAKHKTEKSVVIISKEAAEKRYVEITKIKNSRITDLEDRILSQNDYSTWWFVGGIIAGTSVTLAVLYVSAAIFDDVIDDQ